MNLTILPLETTTPGERAQRLRHRRIDARLSVREASMRFNLTYGQWRDLEAGYATLDEPQWQWLLGQIETLAVPYDNPEPWTWTKVETPLPGYGDVP